MDERAYITGRNAHGQAVSVCPPRAETAIDPRLVQSAATTPEAFSGILAGLREAVDRAAGEAVATGGCWADRVRAGLVAFLGFFDDHPGWGRALLLDVPPGDGTTALRNEQRVLGVLTGLLDHGSPATFAECALEPQLASELVVGGVVAVVRRRMLAQERGSLVELAPGLMALMVAPFLGEGAVRAELAGRAACEGFSVDRAVGPGGEGGRRVRRSIISRGKRSGGL